MEEKTGRRMKRVLALCLYYELPPRLHDKNTPQVKQLASLLGRSVGSVVYKLGNLKALDTSQNGVGFSHGAAMDRIVWNKYLNHPYEMFARKDQILADSSINGVAEAPPLRILPEMELEKIGLTEDFSEEDKKRLQNIREKQWAFRQSLMTGFAGKCCLTGISTPDFLIASHIVPWCHDKENRLNPRNGLLLNVFLDKAFDKGYISVDAKDYSVLVSHSIKDEEIMNRLSPFEGQIIHLPYNPDRYPETQFLEYHNDKVFEHFL